jgi:hypothetical protein
MILDGVKQERLSNKINKTVSYHLIKLQKQMLQAQLVVLKQ